jgi:hypothetical protein
MGEIVTSEGMHVSALCTQTVSNDVYWVVKLAQCQAVRWRSRKRPKLNLRKKEERLLVSLFVLSVLFLLIELHFLYYATKLCKQPRQVLPHLRRSYFFNTKTSINTDGEKRLWMPFQLQSRSPRQKTGSTCMLCLLCYICTWMAK